MIDSRTQSLIRLCLAGSMALVMMSQAIAKEIEDLSWLTGTWVGQIGDMELEETWNQPKAGSIQAVSRLRNGDEMLMVEMIVIDEHEDSFRLRLQQWDPGMEPRETGRQTMELTELKDKQARFEATDEGPLKTLTYHRKSETEFEITVVSAEDETHNIEMAIDPGSKSDSDDAAEATPPNPGESTDS